MGLYEYHGEVDSWPASIALRTPKSALGEAASQLTSNKKPDVRVAEGMCSSSVQYWHFSIRSTAPAPLVTPPGGAYPCNLP